MPGAPKPRRSGTGLVIGLIIGAVVVVLLCVCGIVAIVALASQEENDTDPFGAPATSAPSITETPQTPEISATPPSDPDVIVVGDCVVNDGTDDDASLRKVPCGPDSYEVLSRIPLSIDTEQCEDPILGHEETDSTYVHDSEQTLFDYVLCLKKL